MRCGKLSSIEFYSCYLQQYLLINLFSYSLSYGQKGHMNKVCPSFCQEAFLEFAPEFFLELSMVLGAHVVLCVTGRFFENNTFSPKMGKIGQA